MGVGKGKRVWGAWDVWGGNHVYARGYVPRRGEKMKNVLDVKMRKIEHSRLTWDETDVMRGTAR